MTTTSKECEESRKTLTNTFYTQREIEKDIKTCRANLQQLQVQKLECELVIKEVEKLGPESKLFKLIGGTLISQDIDDSKLTINKRIEFITLEITKQTKKVEELFGKSMENVKKLKLCQAEYNKLISVK